MIEADKKATYTKELWNRWHNARKEWEDHAREDIDFYLGNHFSQSEKNEWERPAKKYNWITGSRY